MNHEKLAKICLEASCRVAGIEPGDVFANTSNARTFARHVAIWTMEEMDVPRKVIQVVMRCSYDTVRGAIKTVNDRCDTCQRDAKQRKEVLRMARKAVEPPRKYKLSRDGYTSGIVCRWQSGEDEDVTGFLHPEVAEDLIKAGLAEWVEEKGVVS